MALKTDWNDLNEHGVLGDWCFFEGGEPVKQYMGFRYRSQKALTERGSMGHIPITTGEKEPDAWLWDGNKDAPTISPSIDVVGEWHGFIQNGILVDA